MDIEKYYIKYLKYKTKYINLQKQYGGAKDYAIIFIWINYSLESLKNDTNKNIDYKTIYRGRNSDEFNKNILDKLLSWQKCHPDADIYLGYDSRMTDIISIENTRRLLEPHKIILFDLITLIDDKFIENIQSFTQNYIDINDAYKLIGEYDYGMNGIPNIPEFNSLKRHQINKYNDIFWYITKEYILDIILGTNNKEPSPLYFRVDMWRLILTLYLSKQYNYVVYSDIDVNPEQEYLKIREMLFDEQTKLWLDTIGFVVCNSNEKSPLYENGFHIMKSNDKTYEGIMTVCIYMNIIRFIMYMIGLFFIDNDYCLEDIFKQIVYVSYEQLFVYLHYLHNNVSLFALKDKEYIEIKEKNDIIPMLGMNCRNKGKYSCTFLKFKKEQKYYDFIEQIKPYRQIDITDNKYRSSLQIKENPTKIIIIGGSTMVSADCHKINRVIEDERRYIE